MIPNGINGGIKTHSMIAADHIRYLIPSCFLAADLSWGVIGFLVIALTSSLHRLDEYRDDDQHNNNDR
jgi:hypothetical protein